MDTSVIINALIALAVLIVGGYIRQIINDLKEKSAENTKDIETNRKAISEGKKELYEHTEKTYYSRDTLDAKHEALKYRQGGRSRGSDPMSTHQP